MEFCGQIYKFWAAHMQSKYQENETRSRMDKIPSLIWRQREWKTNTKTKIRIGFERVHADKIFLTKIYGLETEINWLAGTQPKGSTTAEEKKNRIEKRTTKQEKNRIKL